MKRKLYNKKKKSDLKLKKEIQKQGLLKKINMIWKENYYLNQDQDKENCYMKPNLNHLYGIASISIMRKNKIKLVLIY